MKQKKNLLVALLVMALTSLSSIFGVSNKQSEKHPDGVTQTAGIPIFFSWGGESINKVADFPDNENFLAPDGSYLDAGVKYKQLTIFFIPVWNYDAEWCGYVGNEGNYYIMSHAQLAEFATKASVTLPEDAGSGISFWSKYGGKLVFIVLLLVILGFKAAG